MPNVKKLKIKRSTQLDKKINKIKKMIDKLYLLKIV